MATEIDVLGRDLAAAADSSFDGPVAAAIKGVFSYAGFDGGENPNHLWTVSVDVADDHATVSIVVKDADVYVPPAYPSVPASEAELARVGAEAVVDAGTADLADVPDGVPAAEVEPDGTPVSDAEPAPAPVEELAPVVPADSPVDVPATGASAPDASAA